MNSSEPVSVVLEELESVLREEHAALKSLDYEAIERTSVQKLALDARLRAADANKTPEDAPRLTRVRRMALANQLLIVHARACLSGIIGMVTGEPQATYPGTAQRRGVTSPLRLSVRG